MFSHTIRLFSSLSISRSLVHVLLKLPLDRKCGGLYAQAQAIDVALRHAGKLVNYLMSIEITASLIKEFHGLAGVQP